MAALLQRTRHFTLASQTIGSGSRRLCVKAFSQGSYMTNKEAALTFVKTTNASNKVVIWSKSYCPYCAKAKDTMGKLLKPSDFLVIEIENRPDMDQLQDALLDITQGRSVPRVFVGGEFIGGGDDTVRKASTGELQKLLKAQGLAVK